MVGTTKVYSGVGADIVMESITLIEDTVRFSCEATQTATCERETDSLHRNRVRRDAGLSNSLWFLRPSEAWVSAPMVSTLSKNPDFAH